MIVFTSALLFLIGLSESQLSQSDVSCPCPKIYSPVCGSNGVTYPNRCILECAEHDNVDLVSSNMNLKEA